jgi:hypothetical protein
MKEKGNQDTAVDSIPFGAGILLVTRRLDVCHYSELGDHSETPGFAFREW